MDIFSPKIPNIKFINFWIFGDFSLSFFSRNSKLSKLSSISITKHNRFIRPKNRKKVCIWDKIQDELQTTYIHAILHGWHIWSRVLYCSSLLDYMLGEKCPYMLYCYTQCIFSVACPVFWSKKLYYYSYNSKKKWNLSCKRKNASKANLLAVLGSSIRSSSSSLSSSQPSLFEDSVISLRGASNMKFGEFCDGNGEAVKLYWNRGSLLNTYIKIALYVLGR